MKNVDIIWLVEHVAREMDVACAVKCLAESRYGLTVAIRNMYQHAEASMREFRPRVVIHPFFYFCAGALATEDYVATWPEAIHFNLAWEEMHYKLHQKIKAPSDDFTRESVLHHAWGEFYREYLESYGVPSDHIFVNGHPAYQLYLPPYSARFAPRKQIADTYGLDVSRKWVFVPENYRWAFVGGKIHLFSKLGADPDEITRMRDFSVESLRELLSWCNDASADPRFEIIFRTRPSTNSEVMREFFEEHVRQPNPSLHFIKEGSVREWILASDVVMSSYSTTLIEAAIAGKPIHMIEPVPIPESLQYDWFRFVNRLRTNEDFKAACADASPGSGNALRKWAEDSMLANGDPIEGLARIVQGLVARTPEPCVGGVLRSIARAWADRMPWFSRNRKAHGEKRYFTETTHEHDVFGEGDVQRWCEIWRGVLADATMVGSQGPAADPV